MKCFGKLIGFFIIISGGTKQCVCVCDMNLLELWKGWKWRMHKWTVKCSLRSSEKTWPNCVSFYFFQLKLFLWGNEASRHLKIITLQWSSDAKPLLGNDSEELLPGRTAGFCLLDSGCLKSNAKWDLCYCPLVKWHRTWGTAVLNYV